MNYWIESIGLVSTVLAITGVLLNNRKMICCFYVWIISNTIAAYIHYDAGIYSVLARDLIFMLLAVEGIIKWRRNEQG